jgi:hypothetical protein
MPGDREARGLLTLVCIACGRERHFEHPPPPGLVCDRCGGTVFRPYTTPVRPDEATMSQLEETSREISLGEGSPDTSPGDVRDLNNP